jgi:hypothetical protein
MILFWNPPERKLASAPITTHIKRLDPLGMAFFLPGLVCLLLALQWGGSTYNWNDWRIIMMLVLFGVLIICFAAMQILMPNTATVPPKIITQRSVYCGATFNFFIAGAMLIMVYYVPVWCK